MELRICQTCHAARPGCTTCPGCGGALTLAEPAVFVGETFGKYRLDSILGVGGMGVVYRATHSTLNRPVALKVVLPHVADDQFARRFEREARLLADLKHPNIVTVFDFDQSPWGMPYYIMEFLEGRTLRRLIQEHGPAWGLSDWTPLLQGIAAGLAYAHRRGVVHRDLKPDNVLVVDVDGRPVPKILDYGIAKLVEADQETSALTTTGTVMGTPHYLAPEQIMGQEVGPFTDQYAFALMAAEMLQGRPVREGKTLPEICAVEIRRALPEDWLKRDDLGPGVRKALNRATQPDPGERFPDLGSFLAALGCAPSDSGALRTGASTRPGEPTVQMQSGSGRLPPGVTAAPVETGTAPAGVAPAGSRARWRWGAVAAIAALVLVAGGWALWHRPADAPSGVPPPAPGTPPPSPPATLPAFAPEKAYPTPVDALAVVAEQEDLLVLSGPGCLYLLPMTGDQAPTRIPLSPGQAVLGSTPDGGVYLLDGSRIVVKDFARNLERVWATGLPAGQSAVLSPSGLYLAAVREREVALFRLEEGVPKALFQVKRTAVDAPRLCLGDAYLAIVEAGRLSAHALSPHRELWSGPTESGIQALAIQDESGLLAAGGWFDQVLWYDLKGGGARSVTPHKGKTHSLHFLADGPTLAVGGDGGVQLWRHGKGQVAGWGSPESSVADARWVGGRLFALDTQRRALQVLSWRGFPISESFQVSKREIWSLAADPGKTLFIGGADGALYSLDLPSGRVGSHALHTQGVTSLVLSGDHLASSSDDKTIAVWKVPSMQVVWRSQVHSYLVNQLCLSGSPPTLWSASSDGSVKRWGWPDLQEAEALSTESLLGRRYSLQALWASPDGSSVLAGSWGHALLALEKQENGRWKGRAWPVGAKGLYCAAHVPEAEAVVFVGIQERPGVWIYDLRAKALYQLNSLRAPVEWALAVPRAGRVLVTGLGVVLVYQLSRDSQGRISYGVWQKTNGSMGYAYVAAWVQDGRRVAIGNATGKVHLFEGDALEGEPVYRETLPAAPARP